jgi:protein-tyrosine phosphatase
MLRPRRNLFAGRVAVSRDPSAFGVLFVCTGNVCRSAFAERLLRARLGPDSPVTVSSAGIGALAGHPMEAAMAAAAREYGADPEGFVARDLTAAMVAEADLVLGACREHREAAVRLAPAALNRTFTLAEFVRLAAPEGPGGGDPLERARALVGSCARRRGREGRVEAERDDIADPFGRPSEVSAECARQLGQLVDRLGALLVPVA